jgi:AraC family transcriptional regulator
MTVTIETLGTLRVAAVRHVGPYARIFEAFTRLHEIVMPSDLVRPDTQLLAIYHDDPEVTPADELRADAGITVPEGVALPAGLVEHRLPAGRYARAMHIGPYALLGDAWARLMGEWLPASSERVGSGASYEVYRNTPMDVPPAELRTELYLPLA